MVEGIRRKIRLLRFLGWCLLRTAHENGRMVQLSFLMRKAGVPHPLVNESQVLFPWEKEKPSPKARIRIVGFR